MTRRLDNIMDQIVGPSDVLRIVLASVPDELGDMIVRLAIPRQFDIELIRRLQRLPSTATSDRREGMDVGIQDQLMRTAVVQQVDLTHWRIHDLLRKSILIELSSNVAEADVLISTHAICAQYYASLAEPGAVIEQVYHAFGCGDPAGELLLAQTALTALLLFDATTVSGLASAMSELMEFYELNPSQLDLANLAIATEVAVSGVSSESVGDGRLELYEAAELWTRQISPKQRRGGRFARRFASVVEGVFGSIPAVGARLLFSAPRRVADVAARIVFRIAVEGAEFVPRSGPAIVASNHVSVVDSFVLPVALRRKVYFVGSADHLPPWKARYLFPLFGFFPIHRLGGNAAALALTRASEVLRAGKLFGIYPEGLRSPDGRLYKGHTAAARLALLTGAPVLPVGLIGTAEMLPPGASRIQRLAGCLVRIGRPISAPEGTSMSVAQLRMMTDQIMLEIMQLSGQEYVDRYNPRRGARPPVDGSDLRKSERPAAGRV